VILIAYHNFLCISESQKQLPEDENIADKFLKSILGSDLFDSPSSPKSDSQGKVMSLSFMLWCTGHSRMW